MGVKYVKDFTFDKGFGFTKSSAPSAPMAKKAEGGKYLVRQGYRRNDDPNDVTYYPPQNGQPFRAEMPMPRAKTDSQGREIKTLEQQGDDAARPMDDTDKRRGGPVKRVAKKADGGAMDAPNYPPPALPGAPAVKPRAQVVSADSRGPSATDLAHHQGMVQGARLGARAATSHVLGALSRHAGPQQQAQPAPMPAPAGQPGAPGMKRGGKFIQKAHLKKGALHQDLGVPQGQKIPEAKLKAATHSQNPTTRRRAVLAETMKGFHHGKKD